ncbi:MAG: CDP-alcohol phosphatidyltransferase family protein [Candidatus Hydrogenedentes bacterium]|nr:CDP-alcohol phosphatidyltransferase family protein [Candidatus Hydrogenedentota bacterium]
MAETPYQVTERRPIGSRNWAASKGAAKWLAQRGASPNAISVAGMVCGMLGGVALASTACPYAWERVGWLAGAAMIQARLLANMLDGMVAVESGTASAVGELYNEVPDRVSDTAILLGAGYALHGSVTLGWAAACAALFTAYVRAMGKAAGAPHEFCGPMAKQHRMAIVTVIALFYALAPRSWQVTWGPAPGWSVLSVGLLVIVTGALVTAVRRLARVAANLRRRT